MRKAFVRALCDAAEADPRVVLLTGDLGYMALEPFRDRFPDRFVNAGVAEQNMIGVATGLAEAGFIPFAYSIATFISMRAFEFIRNGPVLHRLPVRIVGMGMGFEYGPGGSTHHAVEDVAMLRTLPGLTIVVPADSRQAEVAVRATRDVPGPVYFTLGKDDAASVPGLNGAFELGRVQAIGDSRDLVIVAMGSVAVEAAAAVALLEQRTVRSALAIVSSFNPDADDHLAEMLAGVRHVITVEAQAISGGLGSFVAGVVASRGLGCRVVSLAVRSPHDGTSGSQPNRWRKHGVDRDSIVAAALDLAAHEGRIS
jgi:transketolase